MCKNSSYGCRVWDILKIIITLVVFGWWRVWDIWKIMDDVDIWKLLNVVCFMADMYWIYSQLWYINCFTVLKQGTGVHRISVYIGLNLTIIVLINAHASLFSNFLSLWCLSSKAVVLAKYVWSCWKLFVKIIFIYL